MRNQLHGGRLTATCVGLATLVAALFTGCSGGGSTEAFCDEVRTGENPLEVFDRYDATNVVSGSGSLDQGVARLEALESAAPDDVKGALSTLVEVAKQLVDVLDARQSDPTAPAPDFDSQRTSIEEASAAVTGFAATECGVQLERA